MNGARTTSAKINIILLVVCGVAIITATPFAYDDYKKNKQCLIAENNAKEIWAVKYQKFLYEIEQGRIEKRKEAKEMELEGCSLSHSNNYESEKCRKHLNRILSTPSSQYTPETLYLLDNPEPYFYCNKGFL
jgi:hypothetical protein